jgi:hypothetical protein
MLVCLPGAILAQRTDVPLADRARGSERIVIGEVTRVDPVWRTNEFGDRLIVSIARVAVEETLKGPAGSSVEVEVEGGTIGEVTLRVSDLEPVTAGERAVFYLKRTTRGAYVPHLRGQGLLKLERDDRVRNSNLRLSDIRRAVGSAR